LLHSRNCLAPLGMLGPIGSNREQSSQVGPESPGPCLFASTVKRAWIAWSEELGRDAIAKRLTTNHNEEKAADKKLGGIAEKTVNLKAAG
jgi:Domain of unknown function (DUF892)